MIDDKEVKELTEFGNNITNARKPVFKALKDRIRANRVKLWIIFNPITIGFIAVILFDYHNLIIVNLYALYNIIWLLYGLISFVKYIKRIIKLLD